MTVVRRRAKPEAEPRRCEPAWGEERATVGQGMEERAPNDDDGAQARGVADRSGSLLITGRRRNRALRGAGPPVRLAGRGGQSGPSGSSSSRRTRAGGCRTAPPGRRAARARPRGALDRDLRGGRRAPASRVPGRGRPRSLLHHGGRRRPPGDPARPRRRPAAAPARDPRQPGRAAGPAPAADRPAEARGRERRAAARLGGGPRPRGRAVRRSASGRGARSSSRSSTPATTGSCATREASTAATSWSRRRGSWRERADVADEVRERLRHVMADELEDAAPAHTELLGVACAADGGTLVATHDPQPGDPALPRRGGVLRRMVPGHSPRGGRPWRSIARCAPGPTIARRACGPRRPRRRAESARGRIAGRVRFWRCQGERAEAQAAAREIEQLLAAGETQPERICVIAASGWRQGRLVAAALEERSVPFRVAGDASFFQRPEVRDALAWLRMLADPNDAAAVVRALTRPPVDLRSADLARMHDDRPPAQARHGLGPRGLAREPPAAPRGPRSDPGVPEAPAFGGRSDGGDAPGRVRAPADRAGRDAPPSPLRGHARDRGAPGQPLAPRRARGGLLAARARAARSATSCATSPRSPRRGTSLPDEVDPPAPGSVMVAEPGQVKGLEFDRVYLLGLHAGSMRVAPWEDRWVPEELAVGPLPEPGEELVAARQRRLAYLAISARVALRRVVVARGGRPRDLEPGAVLRAVRARRLERRRGDPRGGGLRAGRGPALDLPDDPRRGARGVLAGGLGAVARCASTRPRT